MIGIQYLACMFQIQVVLREVIPGQVQHFPQIIGLYRVIGGRRIQPFQLVQLFVENFPDIPVPFFRFGQFLQFFDFIVGRITSQFVLYGLHLLMQEIFALLFVDIHFYFLLNIVFQFQ